VISSTETGIELLYLQDSDVNLYAAHNGNDGIMLFEGRNVRFVGNMHPTSLSDLSAIQNGGSGISVEKSENVTIGHAGRGFLDNGQHGISIGPESRHIELIGVRASGNQGAGVCIARADNVRLSPGGNASARIAGNQAAGIEVEDAAHVRLIALPGEANDIGLGSTVGIEVLGQDSDDIAISGWAIFENREAGIRVADATDVLIGGFGEGEGNSIGVNKNGIVASGAAAQVTIANNHIWRNQPLALLTGMDWRAGPAQCLHPAGPTRGRPAWAWSWTGGSRGP